MSNSKIPSFSRLILLFTEQPSNRNVIGDNVPAARAVVHLEKRNLSTAMSGVRLDHT